ncbi:molecular chaperone DnaJ [Novosphingobium sp.]|uniref:molecular chaperone DnaJ n=1 Tax=Novosphingobium sp. TaxID=1874826 RepID=UPI002FDE1025
MTKLILLAALVCAAVKLLTGRWPWELARGDARSLAEKRARGLLGVDPGAGRTEIIEAHKRLVAMVHPDRGGSNEAVHEANAARDLLLGRLIERR